VARILIVDDEPDVRELFNITLKMAGHVTETAKHGLEAVDKLATDILPELIVLDLMMPHLDGYGLLNHIRNEMSSKPVRVLIATAKVIEDADQEKLGSWPVVGVLNKGELDIGQMVLIVSGALTKNPLRPEAPKEEASKDTPLPATKESPAAPGPSGAIPVPGRDGSAASVSSSRDGSTPSTPTVPATPAANDSPSVTVAKDGPSTTGS
jgi:CheY-like chemotaxis protein